MNDIQIFNNEELKLKVRTIQNEDGSISVNTEDAAIGFGWVKTETKNKKEYTSVRWATINGYCEEFGFDNKLAKDDYIPESLFYMLGMKANNKVAQDFQKWLAVEVIPSVRKTGSYQIPKMSKELQAILLLDTKQQELEIEVKDIRENSPLYTIECKDLQALVKKVGTKALGGYKTPAYNNKSLRGQVYSDIQHQLKREFGVSRYEGIKRCQLSKAREIVQEYQTPTVLQDEIERTNNQISF